MTERTSYGEFLESVKYPWCIKFQDKNGTETNAPIYNLPRSVEILRVEVDREKNTCKFLDREHSGNSLRGIMTKKEENKNIKLHLKAKYPFAFIKWFGVMFLIAVATVLIF